MDTIAANVPQQHTQVDEAEMLAVDVVSDPPPPVPDTITKSESISEDHSISQEDDVSSSAPEVVAAITQKPNDDADDFVEKMPDLRVETLGAHIQSSVPEIEASLPIDESNNLNDVDQEEKASSPAEPSSVLESPKEAEIPTTVEKTPTATIETAPKVMSTPRADDETLGHFISSFQPSITPSPVSPISPSDSRRLSMESMTSIALSEVSINSTNITPAFLEDVQATPRVSGIRHSRKPSSLDILQNTWQPLERQSTFFDTAHSPTVERRMSSYDGERDVWVRQSVTHSLSELPAERNHSLAEFTAVKDPQSIRSSRNSSVISLRRESGASWAEEEVQVNWQALDKTEEQEKEDKDLPDGVEDESTAFLLARLDQENAKFTSDPKSIARARSQSRPPSMAHIKKLVTNLDAPTIRFSLVPELTLPDEPPPMTELEFWAALVQDYPSTAVRLPTLTTTKIRAGIPPPLRGVVWTSMAGARDKDLEESFQKLAGEKSPYEGIINKDVGRSFPGVELFRDAEGEGQRMLGKVLKCFSLHDQEIGYCQGLGFLVGPLLMNMGESEAFCVLVRLMEHYSLRPSFLPSLSGLHMRIYQFTGLLKRHHRTLHDHLNSLGVEPAYLSQWFLSCFAVTCPLSMLFRIYDVIFAEGANETVMRIALALMRRHEDRMLEATEFEEVMQLLLGREIWDCYGGDADLLVDDFTSLGDTVTHASLAELEKEFENQSSETVNQSAGFLPDVQAAASRFLGRLWTPGNAQNTTKSNTVHANKASVTTLSPNSADKDSGSMGFFMRQPSFLRRSPSKQSIRVVTDSQSSDETSSSSGSGSASYASTAATELDLAGFHNIRESYADTISSRSKAESIAPATPSVHAKEQQELHGQIEDLLTALSEMQREHAQLAAMLQREREERSEDHRYMRDLVHKYHKSAKESRRRTAPGPPRADAQDVQPRGRPLSVGDQLKLESDVQEPKDDVEEVLEKLQERLDANTRLSFNLETKAQLRSLLARTREQLVSTEAASRDLHSKLDSAENENDDLRSEVKELRVRVADDFKLRQKLEFEMKELKAKARSTERKQTMIRTGSMAEVPTLARMNSGFDSNDPRFGSASLPGGSAAGLRELRLGRRDSSSSIQSLRQRQAPQIQIEASHRPKASVTIDTALASPISCDTPDTVVTPISATSPLTNTLNAAAKRNRMSYGRRTSSLATQEVLATPALEPVPDEALLLELINSKTSEAQARNEVDELKKALSVGKRKQDEMQRLHEQAVEQLRAELATVKVESQRSAEIVQAVRAESAALKLSTASITSTPIFSLPPTPFLDDASLMSPTTPGVPICGEEKSTGSPPAKTETPSGVGSWFWGRRTTSKTSFPTVQKEVQP